MSIKTLLEQKLKETSVLFESTAEKEKRDTLQEEAYWLTQALENENPNDVLMRAFSFWERTGGKTGLQPFLITPNASPTPTSLPPVKLTLWGMLDRAFQNGEYLDDKHVSDIFNRLPPASQTYFIDTVANHIHTASKQETSVPEKLYTASEIAPVLKDEALLLSLVEKTKLTAASKEKNVERVGRKLTEWLRYHETEPATEQKLEEVLYGIEAEKSFMKKDLEENKKLRQYISEGGILSPQQEETITETLPHYELLIRDRLRMTTAEYLRVRHVSMEKLLAAVPADPKKLALITQSAIRQDLLAVPEAEFQKRVRTAALIRAYSFNKELYLASIRQFFRSVVEE